MAETGIVCIASALAAGSTCYLGAAQSTIVATTAVIAATTSFGIFKLVNSSWYDRQVLRITAIGSLVRGMNPGLAPSTVAFAVNNGGRSASISYSRLGEHYVVHLPYQRRSVTKMLSFNAAVHKNDGSVINITQQPGLPYLTSANDFGAERIVITNGENGKTASYTGDTIPGFATELLD